MVSVEYKKLALYNMLQPVYLRSTMYQLKPQSEDITSNNVRSTWIVCIIDNSVHLFIYQVSFIQRRNIWEYVYGERKKLRRVHGKGGGR